VDSQSSLPPIPSTRWESSFSPIKNYFATLYQILTRPAQFFKLMPRMGGVSGPLAFALITHWVGSAVQFLWRSAIGTSLAPYWNNLFKITGDVVEIDNPGRNAQLVEMRDRITHWIWGAGSVVADPFLTLTSILFVSLLVFVGARIFVTPRDGQPESQVNYESAIRIVCFGMAPSILAGLPFLGGVVAALFVLIVTVIAAREVYHVDTGRAIVIALFPKLLFLGVLVLGVAFLALAVIKLFAMAF